VDRWRRTQKKHSLPCSAGQLGADWRSSLAFAFWYGFLVCRLLFNPLTRAQVNLELEAVLVAVTWTGRGRERARGCSGTYSNAPWRQVSEWSRRVRAEALFSCLFFEVAVSRPADTWGLDRSLVGVEHR
jgi:hypothetical protein